MLLALSTILVAASCSNGSGGSAGEDEAAPVYAYIGGSTGLDIVNVADPASPVLVGSYATAQYVLDVKVSGDLAVLSTGSQGVFFVDVSDPTSPTLKGRYTVGTWTNAKETEISGDYAYIAYDSQGLVILNISNPASPSYVMSISKYTATGVTLSGNYAYVALATSGFGVVDVSTPSSAAYVGTCACNSNKNSSTYQDSAQQCVVSGNYAYVTEGSGGLAIVDISTPASPSQVGYYVTPDFARGIDLSGDFAYVTDIYNGIYVIGVSTPTAPSQYNFSDLAMGDQLLITGGKAYVPTYEGLKIIDISNPASPALKGTYGASNYYCSVYLE